MINLKVRFKNPVFIAQLILAILTPILAYAGLTAQDLTTWSALGNLLLSAVLNPYVLALVIVSVWNAINDPDINNIPIEIGQGINLLNSLSIKCLNDLSPISTVDFTSFSDIESTIKTIKKIKNEIPNRKYTIAGNIRVPSLGLCPLNNDSAIISRLSCKAPCHKGDYALHDPSLNKLFPFTCDGFCRMHMFEDRILEQFDRVEELYKAGVNEFVFDFSALNAKFVPVLLNKFFME